MDRLALIITVLIFACGMFILTPTLQAQTTWYVDDDAPGDPGPGDPTVSDPAEDGSAEHPFDAIQKAVNVAYPDETVLVLDGTYTGTGNRGMSFYAKHITLRSENGPETCIIDCEGVTGACYFDHDDSIIRGFTIQNGDTSSYGGAVYCWRADAKILNNIFLGNTTGGEGGAIYCHESAPTIMHNVFSENRALDYHGGAIFCYEAAPVITDNTFTGNTAAKDGGAFYVNSMSVPRVLRNTISGNRAGENGGGIYIVDNSPRISHNMISGNTAGQQGGGISIRGNFGASDAPVIFHNTIAGNTGGTGGGISCDGDVTAKIYNNHISGNISYSDGGGLYCLEAGPSIRMNTIDENKARSRGGGIYSQNASPSIVNNTITGNNAGIRHLGFENGSGGGISCRNGGNPTMTRNTVAGNQANIRGGGISCEGASPALTGNQISSNTAGEKGGGIYCDNASPVMSNNTISDNLALGDGGGIYFDSSSPSLNSCTLTDNFAGVHGGGICCLNASPAITDTILWGDAPEEIYVYSGTPSVSYSDVQGGYPGTGNINADPLFIAEPESDYYLSQIAAGQGSDSPCLNTGDPVSPMIHGTTRTDSVQDVGTIDMGCHAILIIQVPAHQATIQAGIDAAEDGDTVLVADGTYTGDGNRDLDFGGKAITLQSENGPDNCVIDCEGESHYGIYFQNDEERDSVLEGFTIRNTVDYPGVMTYRSSPIIRNNIITGNLSAGIACSWLSYPLILNNTISNNTLDDYAGGGISVDDSSPEIISNTITGNTATWGGGIYWYNDSPVIMNNTIQGNTAEADGGGISCSYHATYAVDNFSALMVNNLISGNTANGNLYNGNGGAIDCHAASPTMINNTITDNITANGGGGISCWEHSHPLISNTIFWNNDGSTGDQIYLEGSSDPSSAFISFSDIQGGQSGVYIGSGCALHWGPKMIQEDPLFVNGPMGSHYLSHIAASQPANSPCINGGDPDSETIEGTTRTDWVGDAGKIDMGYHYPHYLANPRVTSPVGTEDTFFTYAMDLRTIGDVAPEKVFIEIDRAYAGEMTLRSGTAGYGTYEFSTYLSGAGHHEVVFYCDLSAEAKPAGLKNSLYSLPSDPSRPFHFPLIVELQEVSERKSISH